METEKLTKEQLEKALKDLPVGDIYCFEKVASTNDLGFEKAALNAPDMTVITAYEQVQGRGRMQRRWITAPGTSLPMTVIIHPTDREIEYLSLFSPLTALALREGLRLGYGIESQVKWPNDILLRGRKISGILCETMWENDSLQALILGIGINLLHGSAPDIPDINYPASSVEDETGIMIPRTEWIRTFLAQLIRLRPLLGTPDFFALWESCLAYKGEKALLVSANGQKETCTVLGIAPDGSLVTENEAGKRKSWLAGEISLRKALRD